MVLPSRHMVVLTLSVYCTYWFFDFSGFFMLRVCTTGFQPAARAGCDVFFECFITPAQGGVSMFRCFYLSVFVSPPQERAWCFEFYYAPVFAVKCFPCVFAAVKGMR